MLPRNAVAVLAFAVLLGRSLEADDAQRLCPPPPPCLADVEASSVPTLPLAWLDVTGSGRQAEKVARSESRAILQAMGLHPIWRRATAAEPARPREIRVVLIDRLLVDPESREPVLGATPPGTRVHPVVWIHVPGVRVTLRLSSGSNGSAPSPRDRRALGIALGRVIAHEVVHVLAPSLSHGRGLMARALTRRQLTAPRLSFEPGVALVVRAALEGSPASAPAAGILAAASPVAPEPRTPPRAAGDDRRAGGDLGHDDGSRR